MTSTALGAETKKEEKIIFISDARSGMRHSCAFKKW